MKRGLIIFLIVSLSMVLSACKMNHNKQTQEDFNRNDMAHILSRARYDGDMDKIYECTPNIFLSDELKNRYVKKINCEGMAYRNLVGVQNMKYNIVNAGVRAQIFSKLASDYGVDEGLRNDVSKAGYFTYDIVWNDKKGNKKVKKNKDLIFLYDDKWYIVVLDD